MHRGCCRKVESRPSRTDQLVKWGRCSGQCVAGESGKMPGTAEPTTKTVNCKKIETIWISYIIQFSSFFWRRKCLIQVKIEAKREWVRLVRKLTPVSSSSVVTLNRIQIIFFSLRRSRARPSMCWKKKSKSASRNKCPPRMINLRESCQRSPLPSIRETSYCTNFINDKIWINRYRKMQANNCFRCLDLVRNVAMEFHQSILLKR